MDKLTGKVHRRYALKRNPCNSLILNSPRVRHLVGYNHAPITSGQNENSPKRYVGTHPVAALLRVGLIQAICP